MTDADLRVAQTQITPQWIYFHHVITRVTNFSQFFPMVRDVNNIKYAVRILMWTSTQTNLYLRLATNQI